MSSDPKDEEEFDFSSDRSAGKVQDFMKNAVMSGLSALFMTEDTIRNIVKEKKLPVDWASDLFSAANKRKDELMGIVGKEMTKFFQHIDVQKEVSQFLENHTMKISAKVTFEPREERQHGSTQQSHQDT